MKDIAQILLVGLGVLALYLVGPVGGLLSAAASRAVGIQPAAVLVLAIMVLPIVVAIAQAVDARRTIRRLPEIIVNTRDRKAA
jgi:hypothetical protein